jgi:hypothetical protein
VTFYRYVIYYTYIVVINEVCENRYTGTDADGGEAA